MKIGFCGDPHMGGSQGLGRIDFDTQLNSRLLDFSITFNGIIDKFVERGVKVGVLLGDSYDVKNPPPAVVNVFSKCLMRAVNNGMRMLLLVGNHDQQRAISTTSVDIYNSLNMNNIISFPEFSVYTLKEDGEEVHLVMMPYRDKNMFPGAFLPEQAIEMMRKDIQGLTANLKGKKIAVPHFMIGRTITGETSEIFSINELVLPINIFDGFDATIGGHVHKHEVIQKEPLIMYAGSMDKISFGEKDHTKVSIIFDTKTNEVEIIPSPVRELYEMNFDYSTGDKEYKAQINDKIIADIEEYAKEKSIEDTIVKLVIKLKENDSYHVNQERLREFILSKKVNHLVPIQISTVSTRNLRNKEITEDTDSKTAMGKFIKALSETDTMKKKLLKAAEEIIEKVDGK